MKTPDLDPGLVEDAYPLQRHLGFDMTAWAPDYARLEAPLAETLMNRQGLPHGGVHAALLDSAMGFDGCYTGDPNRRQLALTLSLTGNYSAHA